jgi:hypothetical protein
MAALLPTTPIFNAGGRLDPTPIINTVFRNGKAASKEGRIPLSVEEGLLRILANRAADPETGSGIFDSTISIVAASRRIVGQTEQPIAYHASKGSAQGVINSLSRSQYIPAALIWNCLFVCLLTERLMNVLIKACNSEDIVM